MSDYSTGLAVAIPAPSLEISFRLICDLEAVRPLGEGLEGNGGDFNWVGFTGGRFEGSWGSGIVVPGGQDSQHVLPSTHPSAPLYTSLSTRYLLKTDDPEPTYIQLQTRGWRTGPVDILSALLASAKEGGGVEIPGPDEYKMRLFVEMETDARSEKYAWLNTAMWVGSGLRSGRQVIYDAYLIE